MYSRMILFDLGCAAFLALIAAGDETGHAFYMGAVVMIFSWLVRKEYSR